MFGLGAGELFLILVLALIFIGPKKLPELAKGLGKGLREFNKAKNELVKSMNTDDDNEKSFGSGQQLNQGEYSSKLSTDDYKNSLIEDETEADKESRQDESEKLVGVGSSSEGDKKS